MCLLLWQRNISTGLKRKSSFIGLKNPVTFRNGARVKGLIGCCVICLHNGKLVKGQESHLWLSCPTPFWDKRPTQIDHWRISSYPSLLLPMGCNNGKAPRIDRYDTALYCDIPVFPVPFDHGIGRTGFHFALTHHIIGIQSEIASDSHGAQFGCVQLVRMNQ